MSPLTPSGPGIRIRTAALGGSPLSRAIQARRTPDAWRTAPPLDRRAWRAHLETVRDAAGEWLPRVRAAFGEIAHTGARQRLADAAARGVLVTTGQQPGLFGGPAYTLTKALSALALADELQAAFGLPVAPVFWAATDDADWREASLIHVVGRDGLLPLAMRGPPTDGVPLAVVPLGDVSAQREALRAACGSVAEPMVLDLVDAAYTAGATVGGAYLQWLRGMLEPLGIVVLDASHAALRTALDPVARQALHAADAIDRALRARTQDIVAAGLTPQVELVDGLSLVFETHGDRRARVPLDAASAQATAAPVGSLGANVLLRPVLERAVLPTVAYIAGPGELAYFAQATAVAEALGAPVPVAVPRWSADWQEPQVERLMTRLGVTDEELADPHLPETRLARAALDRDVTDAVERLRVMLDAQLSTLGRAVAEADALVPDAVVTGLARDLGHRLDRVERRLVAAVKRRQGETARELAVARAARHPHGTSPERVLSLVPTLARHGLGVLSAMRDEAAVHARALIAGPAGDATPTA
jgi:bacillithiol biosynthesis cysteine-adding enzyme BshC